MELISVFWTVATIIISANPFLVFGFEWEYAATYSFEQTDSYALKVFKNSTSGNSVLHFLAILTDETSEDVFEEAETIAHSWEDSEVPVSHGNKLTINRNLLFAFEIADGNAVSIFSFDFNEPQLWTFLFDHSPDEEPFQFVDSSGMVVLPSLEESAHEESDTSTEDEQDSITSDTWGSAIMASLVCSILSIGGLLFFFALKTKEAQTLMLNASHAFGSGATLAASLIHLMPESYVFLEEYGDAEELGWKTGTVVLAGLSSSLIIHALFATHTHEVSIGGERTTVHTHVGTPASFEMSSTNDFVAPSSDQKLQDQKLPALTSFEGFSLGSFKDSMGKLKRIQPRCWNIFVGDMIHNFLDGVLIAAAFASCGQTTGWTILAVIIAHEIPLEIADFFVFLESGMGTLQATIFNLLSGLSSILGAVVLLSATSSLTKEHLGYLLLWGSGMFIFIGATELLPEVLKEGKPKVISMRVFAFVLGAVIVSLPLMNHQHCEAGSLGHDHGDHSGDDHDDHDH